MSNDINLRVAAILSAHKPCIGYWNTGTTLDDSQHWSPTCECGWGGRRDVSSEEQAITEHTAHVAATVTDLIEELAGTGQLT